MSRGIFLALIFLSIFFLVACSNDSGQEATNKATEDDIAETPGRVGDQFSDLAENTKDQAAALGTEITETAEQAGEKLSDTSEWLSEEATAAGEMLPGDAANKPMDSDFSMARSSETTGDASDSGTKAVEEMESTAALMKDKPDQPSDLAAFAPVSSQLENVTFEHNSSEISRQSLATLDRLVDQLQNEPMAKVEISGYTDNRGRDDYNQWLSTRRANLVKDYLASKGISEGKLSVRGYGSKNPIADNSTTEGRQANRRVELKILK